MRVSPKSAHFLPVAEKCALFCQSLPKLVFARGSVSGKASTVPGVPLLYYQNPLFVTTKTVNMLLTVCQGGHHRPVVVNKVLTTEKCVNSKRRSVALC